MDIYKWTPQQRCVGELIIEMLQEKAPSGRMAFEPKDIYQNYKHRLSAMLPNYKTEAIRKRNVIQIFKNLKARGELVQPGGPYTPYYLAEEGSLYHELKLSVANKKL